MFSSLAKALVIQRWAPVAKLRNLEMGPNGGVLLLVSCFRPSLSSKNPGVDATLGRGTSEKQN